MAYGILLGICFLLGLGMIAWGTHWHRESGAEEDLAMALLRGGVCTMILSAASLLVHLLFFP